MKNISLLFLILFATSAISLAKKDTDAWKKEKTLELQYAVFKKNLNFWNGSFFLDENQLNDFYTALTDSLSLLRIEVQALENQKEALQNDLDSEISLARDTQLKLDESKKRENSFSVFKMNINKRLYTITVYTIILGVLILCGIVFLLFKRSNSITVRTKKEFEELKEEYEVHKKNSLDRYTKMNMELHKTRLELNKK